MVKNVTQKIRAGPVRQVGVNGCRTAEPVWCRRFNTLIYC